MRILHVSQYCHAGSIGGTERYLQDLVHGLQAIGVGGRIAWLRIGSMDPIVADGVAVHPLPAAPAQVDAPPPELAPATNALVEEFRPDVVHFHTFGLAEASIAELCVRRGVPYCFTYHSPAWTCRREDLLAWGGVRPCDGQVRTARCAACKMQQRFGGPPLVGYLGAAASSPLDLVGRHFADVNVRRRLCVLSDTSRFRRALREFLGRCDVTISCSEWGRPVLVANGAPVDRVEVIPQGVPTAFTTWRDAPGTLDRSDRRPTSRAGSPFTIGYVGRVTPVKGVDVLADGFTRMQGSDIRLRIFGMAPDEPSLAPLNSRLSSMAASDPRIELHPKLSLSDVVRAYRGLDLVAIPSITLETGPLVLFEAMQMGVPVFGSDRVGHPSLLPQSGGMVVETNSPAGWQSALETAVDEFRSGTWHSRLERLASAPRLKSMGDVARDMKDRYRMASTVPRRA
jgi:glycosyltransferase involved in cell wall biosynthesis